MISADKLLQFHESHAWQPFTQMKLAGEPILIDSADGVFLRTRDRRTIIDAVGSWWVSIHGHGHPRIREAIEKQLPQLEQVMYAGFTHEGAAVLSRRLSALTENRLPRVFFSDNGSTAVEIALKMAYQYNVNTGRPEKKGFIALQNGYHGDTVGTMSVGSRAVFHKIFEPMLFPVYLAESPNCEFKYLYDPVKSTQAVSSAVQDMERLLQNHSHQICAAIIEPVIQGAGGMNIYPPSYLKEIRTLCDTYNVFLIADEVFTGCGRTGTMFACQQAGMLPDLMALSKGLSAGFLPFAATLATEKIYQAFYSDDRMRTFFHGHSMTANPLGCAAALASLDILESEKSLEKVRLLAAQYSDILSELEKSPAGRLIKETRYIGSVAAIELQIPDGYTGEFSPKFMKLALDRGVLLRPLGSVIYLTPPYIIQKEELRKIFSVIEECIPLAVQKVR